MTDSPLLLLDVDGVLCPIGPGGGDTMLESSAVEGGFCYAEPLPARLAMLTEAFALVWATGWQHQANEVLCPLFGLPELPVIEFGEDAFRLGTSLKLPAIRQYVKDRPFAWVDDEIGHDAHRWARRRSAPTLLLDVRPDVGLTQATVDTLLQFAAAVTPRAARSPHAGRRRTR